MKQFISRHGDRLQGVLSGFDRLRFRGTLLLLTSEGGMMEFLWRNQILLRDFGGYVDGVTDRVRCASEALAAQTPYGRIRYLPSTRLRKEVVAREMAEQAPDREGLVAVLSCVKPCRSFHVRRNSETKRLRLEFAERQCLHHYFYFRHPEFGLLHVRLQTWFPFTVHVWLNGREWLCRDLDRAGIGYVRRENCLVAVDDVPQAQALLLRQLRRRWPRLLDGLLRSVHPEFPAILGRCPMEYYWSVDESEWATDLLFRSPADLARLYPRLVRHGLLTFGSGEVLRFLGRKAPATGRVHGAFQGEVVSDLRHRPEGLRLKHRVKRNTIKMYDKQESVLRVETTLIDPRDMKVFRPAHDDPQGPRDWRTLRKGVADLHRRAQVCQQANERYLEALATVDDEATVAELSDPLCRAVTCQGRRWRALNPLGDADARLLEVVHRGEFAVNGFRNRDLRELLCAPEPQSPEQVRRQSTRITRQLALLRAHRLIKKVPKTHRYVLTEYGRTTIATLLTLRSASSRQLTQAI